MRSSVTLYVAFLGSQKIATGIVFTGDDLTAELSEYFMDFQTGNIRFQNLQRSSQLVGQHLYILVNTAASPFVNEAFATEVLRYDQRGLEKIYQENTLILYRVINKNSLVALKRFAVY